MRDTPDETKKPGVGRALPRGLVRRAYSAPPSSHQPETEKPEAEQRQCAGFRHRRWRRWGRRVVAVFTCRIDVAGRNLCGRPLYADGESVPVFVGLAAPRHCAERAEETDRTVGLAATHIAGVQLILESTAAEIDNLLGDSTTSPVSTGMAVDAADTQDLEILVESVAIEVEADEGKDRVGDSFGEAQRLASGVLKRNDVGAGWSIVDLCALIR